MSSLSSITFAIDQPVLKLWKETGNVDPRLVKALEKYPTSMVNCVKQLRRLHKISEWRFII